MSREYGFVSTTLSLSTAILVRPAVEGSAASLLRSAAAARKLSDIGAANEATPGCLHDG